MSMLFCVELFNCTFASGLILGSALCGFADFGTEVFLTSGSEIFFVINFSEGTLFSNEKTSVWVGSVLKKAVFDEIIILTVCRLRLILGIT